MEHSEGPAVSPVPPSLARDDPSCRLVWLRAPPQCAGVGVVLKRKSVPSTHIRCMMTASFLASATLARFAPRRRAMAMAQAFNDDQATTRVIMTWAASNRATRTETSPALLIAPLRALAGLVTPWRQSETGADRLGRAEALRLIDGGPEGEGDNRADAGDGH